MKVRKLSPRENAVVGLIFNLAFAFYNGILGYINSSAWFGATGVCYLLMCIMRFVAVMGTRDSANSREQGIALTAGVLLSVESMALGVVLVYSLTHRAATQHGTIVMITIATYTFLKIGMAVSRAIKHRGDNSRAYKALRAIGYTEVAMSLFSMQRSMLVSFGEMNGNTATVLNAFTGGAVCVFVLLLGIITIKSSIRRVENG